MKPTRLTAFTVLCVLTGSLISCSGPNGPQAATSTPMVAVLQATKQSDAERFRNAYSKRIRQESQQSNWAKNFQEAQANMKKMFGDYQLSDFAYSFAGDDLVGKLTVSFKGKKQFGIAIVKEDGAWKLDER